jgi:hypothetical protein
MSNLAQCLAWDQVLRIKMNPPFLGKTFSNKESIAVLVSIKHKICVFEKKNSLQIWTYTCTTYYYVLQFPICQKKKKKRNCYISLSISH